MAYYQVLIFIIKFNLISINFNLNFSSSNSKIKIGLVAMEIMVVHFRQIAIMTKRSNSVTRVSDDVLLCKKKNGRVNLYI